MSVTDPGKRLQKILWPNKKEDRQNNFVLAGLGPAIHAFEEPKQGVDATDQVRARRIGAL
jgi:hypothetical protein